MTEIRAFVGHSFEDGESPVVEAFLQYLTSLQKSISSFEWTSARDAEPKELAQKVLEIFSDCNAFIGICTCKERAISHSKLSKSFLLPNQLWGRTEEFEWKASDWVIQEIGMAIGRGIPLILLLENGCRKPGGMQGNVEFIPFDRSSPSDAFIPLMDMIRSLSPPPQALERAKAEAPPETSDEVPQSTQADDDTPDITWKRDRYVNSYIWKMIRDDAEGAKSIDLAYAATPVAQDEVRKAEWTSITESWNVVIGEGGSLDRLRELHSKFPENVEISTNFASALSTLGDHAESARMYELAANEPSNDIAAAEQNRRAAIAQLARAGSVEMAYSMLDHQRQIISSMPEQEISVVHVIRDIAVIEKDDDSEIVCMERIVDLKPDDFDTRFSLAFKHSSMDNNDLALHHYLQIPRRQRTPVTWNNLGVSYQRFQMQGKAVTAYKKSAAQGETLAMSNLGYKLMQAGFVEEAEAELNKALKIKDFHRNIGEGIAALRDIPDSEEKKERETLEGAKRKIQFFQLLGRAIVHPSHPALAREWIGPECDLQISIQGRNFSAVGEYEKSSTGNALGSLTSFPRTTRHKIEFEGKVHGLRILGTVKKTVIGGESATSLLGRIALESGDKKVAMIIADDGRSISIMESPYSSLPSFYELARKS